MIIDSLEELALNIDNREWILIPIQTEHRTHPSNTTVTALYITDISCSDSFIVPIDHTEAFGELSLHNIIGIFKDMSVYTVDRKSWRNLECNPHDLSLIFFLHGDRFDQLPTLDSYYEKWNSFNNINRLIPLSILYDAYYNFFKKNSNYIDKFVDYLPIIETDTYINYIETIDSFYAIESNGLRTTDGWEYSQYYLWNYTGRPSNRFNKVNYAALRKDDNTRSRYVSRFTDGYLALFDYEAFHPNIIAKYTHTSVSRDSSLHYQLGQHYYNAELLTDEQLAESKKKTFYHLYGNIPDELTSIDFYKNARTLIDSFADKSHIESPIYKRKINTDGFSKQKSFNYFLQAFESEINFIKIRQLNQYLSDKKSKLILYIYDAFLLDVHPDESTILDEVSKILEGSHFKVSVQCGANYKDLK